MRPPKPTARMLVNGPLPPGCHDRTPWAAPPPLGGRVRRLDSDDGRGCTGCRLRAADALGRLSARPDGGARRRRRAGRRLAGANPPARARPRVDVLECPIRGEPRAQPCPRRCGGAVSARHVRHARAAPRPVAGCRLGRRGGGRGGAGSNAVGVPPLYGVTRARADGSHRAGTDAGRLDAETAPPRP